MAAVKVFTIAYVIHPDTGHILMMRRAADRAINAGRLSAPGGKVEAGEDILAAAKRELLEETGLVADDATYRGCYAYTSSSLKNPAGHIHFVTVGRFHGELKPEHAEGALAWYAPEAIFADPTFGPDHRTTLRQILETGDVVAATGQWEDGRLASWHDSAPFYGTGLAS